MAKGEPTSEKLVQDYVSTMYPKRYSGNGFLYHSKIVTEMLNGIKFRDGKYSDKVLDLGCGIGFVSQLYPNHDIVGLDISDGMLANNPHNWVKGSAEKIPFPDNHFDFVVVRSLLHHLEDATIGLKEIYRVLKLGGKVSFWDPNAGSLADTFRRIFQKTDRFSHLHHSFTDRELFSLIEEAGLRITSKRYIGFLAYPLCGFPDIKNFGLPLWLGRALIRIDDFLSKTFLKRMAWSLMVKGEK